MSIIKTALIQTGTLLGGAIGATIGTACAAWTYQQAHKAISPHWNKAFGHTPEPQMPRLDNFNNQNRNNDQRRDFDNRNNDQRRDRDRNFHHTGGQYSRHDAQRFNNDRRDYPKYDGRPYVAAE